MVIYKVTNTQTGKCYIGKTINTLHHRKTQHLKVRKCRNYPFYNSLNKYGLDSFTWEVIDTCDSEDKLNDLEKYYIQQYNTMHPNGYNLSLGGDGQSGFKHREESIQKIIKNNKMRGIPKEQHPMYGKKHSKESLIKMSISASNRERIPHSEETKQKLSTSKLGKLNPQYGKPAPNTKKVRCIETQEVYDTIKKAYESTGVEKANISAVCRGVRPRAGGFTWEFI